MIDFVITWVDGNDIEWQKQKNKYLPDDKKIDVSDTRYREWDILKYWFRSIEKNANWVNTIYFVTNGQVPKWLNTNHPKLKIINHTDIMDEECLPTFNSCAIEMNLHKIEGLSEEFVYFNDDMFINDKVTEDDFFKENFPLDNFILTPVDPKYEASASIHYNCMKVINKNFDYGTVKSKNRKKLINIKNGKYLIKNFSLMIYPFNVGIRFHHLPTSFLKSTFEEVWKKEKDLVSRVSKTKFRTEDDVSQWLFQYWQISSGNFIVRNISEGKYYDLGKNFEGALDEIRNGRHKIICLNDNGEITDFENKKRIIGDVFKKRYPNKSEFERIETSE